MWLVSTCSYSLDCGPDCGTGKPYDNQYKNFVRQQANKYTLGLSVQTDKPLRT